MLAAILLTGAAAAQVVTVMSPSIGAPEPGFTGKVAAGMSLARGNKTQNLWSGAADTLWVNKGGDHQLLFTAAGDYGEAFGQVNTQDVFAHLRYRWAFLDSAPLVAFTFIQTQHNAFQSLLLRNLGGAGLEYRLWRADWTEAWLGTAVMGEHERLSTDNQDRYFVRSSSFALIAVEVDEALVLGSSTYFQPLLTDFNDWRFVEELTLNGKFGEHFGWLGALTLTHDRVPPTGVEPTDLSVSSGLTWGW